MTRGSVLTVTCLLVATAAFAQEARPVGPFVVDARGSLARYGQDPIVAQSVGLLPARLPNSGLGIEIGAHVYPLSLGKARVGFGGSLHWSRGRHTPVDAAGKPTGDQTEVKFVSIAPQASLNFGKHDGWSYISGGIGWTTRRYQQVGTTLFDEATPKISTINYGGGARWFMKKHVAFTFDFRFYRLAAHTVTSTGGTFAIPATRRVIISLGASFK